jgi:GT2 family glycosyltransferase
MTHVSVLVVSFNAADHLARCLTSLDQATSDHSIEVIVVDNASTDDAVATARRVRPDAAVLALDENVGFGRGMNRAATLASGRWLLLLNPDAELHPGAIDRIVRTAEQQPDAGLYGGLTLTADGQPDGMHCWGLPSLWSLTCFALGLSTAFRRSRWLDPEAHGNWPTEGPYRVDAISGAFLLVDRSAWEALGGFDEDYFLYAEDLDLCARAATLGYHCLVEPAARLVHALGASSAARPDRRIAVLRGKVTYLRKHWGPWRFRLGRRLLWTGVALRSAAGHVSPSADREWPEVWRRRHEWLAGYPVDTDRRASRGADERTSASSGRSAGAGSRGSSGTGPRRSTGTGPSNDA